MRTEAGLSQRALATRLRVPHSWVAKVESGERRLDTVEFIEFAQACGCDASEAFEDIVQQMGASPVKRAGKGVR